MTEKREKRKFWASLDGRIHEVEGLRCDNTSDPVYWWVPALGNSMPEGISLFPHRRQAFEAAEADCERRIADWTRRLEALRAES